MEVLACICLMLFLVIFIVLFITLPLLEKWRINFLNDKFKLLNKDKFTEIINLYKELSFIDKIKFKYLVNYSNCLDIIKEKEIQ